MGILERLRARRRYRRMMRRLAELDRVDRMYGLGASVPGPRSGPRQRPWWARSGAVTVVTVGLVVALVALGAPEVIGERPADPAGTLPAVPDDAAGTRLLPAVATGSVGPHVFGATLPDGTPVTHDPCRPLHYVVNPAGMPSGALDVLRAGARDISAATGLVLTEQGVTSEAPVEGREPVQPDRYGDRWAPVLVAWADPAAFPLVDGDIAGVTQRLSVTTTGPDTERYVTGLIVFDAPWMAEALADPQSAASARTVVLHEFGHLVGLDHVLDEGEIMGESSDATELGPGDRQGLAALGGGACRTDT